MDYLTLASVAWQGDSQSDATVTHLIQEPEASHGQTQG